MYTLSRKQRELFEREQLILDTAQRIVNRKGIAGLTMERIATEIRYSKGTVYNHFASLARRNFTTGTKSHRHCTEYYQERHG